MFNIFLNGRSVFAAGDTGVELGQIEADYGPGVSADAFIGQAGRPGDDAIAKLPVAVLFTGATNGFGRAQRRAGGVQRHVAADEADAAGFDVLRPDLGKSFGVEALAQP